MPGQCCVFQIFDDGGAYDKRYDESHTPRRSRLPRCRDGEGGFADAAFLIQERDNHLARHISLFVGRCKYGSVGIHILRISPSSLRHGRRGAPRGGPLAAGRALDTRGIPLWR